MKRELLLIMFCVFAVMLNAQIPEAKVIWDFPIQPGTEEWNALRTDENPLNAYNIPDEILRNISTEELVKTCLSYPQWGLIHAYNSRVQGFSVIIRLFNGFSELFNRMDATTELMKAYNQLDPLAVDPDWTDLLKGMYSHKFEGFEILFFWPGMIEKLDKAGIRELKETVISKYQKKRILPEIYDMWCLSPTVAVCATIIRKENFDLFNSISGIGLLMFNLYSEDIYFMDSIVELLEKMEI